ncbi:hypothetical protein Pint_02177 [Pistacia integerrima]|uniref:Uncharacterized protein n=1 Tax=Pistacia integerrima TaxID=434235 RepID=A0ACC0ZET2_9ROSI|nr:hypothetical protein Pint_02177 [Pistacia integerrima]
MAVGGSHKVMNSSNRGRPYGLMLLLAFGAALFGVMVLHKLRERSIFNLLVKEKDHELISLHLLLQKEREYNRDVKNKNEEMKAKMYTLSTQKMELDRRLLEMQSTIDSLKDEQRTLKSALEEMKNEIKMRREAEIGSAKEISQLTALKESLKQKKAEIEDLKLRLGFPIEVSINMSEKDKSNLSLSKEKDGESSKYNNIINGEKSTRVEDGSEKTVEQWYKHETSQEEDSKESDESGSDVGKQINITNSMEAIVNADENVSKLEEKNSDERDGNESKITKHRVVGKADNSQDESQEVQTNSKGGKKLETLDSIIDAGPRLRGKHGHVGRTKRKRWRMLARSRDADYNRRLPRMSRRFHRLDRDELSKRESQISNDGIRKGETKAADENLREVRKAVDSEYLENRDVKAEPQKLQVEQENVMLEPHNSLDVELRRNTTADDDSTKISSYAENQKLDEFRQPEEDEEAGGTEQKMSSGNNNEEENIGKQVKDDNKPEMTDEVEVGDMQEKEAESTSYGDSDRESNSNLEEGKEEYKAETDDSEF